MYHHMAVMKWYAVKWEGILYRYDQNELHQVLAVAGQTTTQPNKQACDMLLNQFENGGHNWAFHLKNKQTNKQN